MGDLKPKNERSSSKTEFWLQYGGGTQEPGFHWIDYRRAETHQEAAVLRDYHIKVNPAGILAAPVFRIVKRTIQTTVTEEEIEVKK